MGVTRPIWKRRKTRLGGLDRSISRIPSTGFEDVALPDFSTRFTTRFLALLYSRKQRPAGAGRPLLHDVGRRTRATACQSTVHRTTKLHGLGSRFLESLGDKGQGGPPQRSPLTDWRPVAVILAQMQPTHLHMDQELCGSQGHNWSLADRGH